MSNFSPAWAYQTEHPYPQYWNDARYPGNSVMATVGATMQQKANSANMLAACPGFWLTGAILGSVSLTLLAYATHYKLIKKKKMKLKGLWMYTLLGFAVGAIASGGGSFVFSKVAKQL